MLDDISCSHSRAVRCREECVETIAELCRRECFWFLLEARIRDHLGEMVRGTVEETLNAMLDAEADRLCGAGRYERSEARQDSRAGSYERTLHTKAGEVSLRIPKLRRQTFETAIIERYRRRESSVEEALIEMYLAGVSVRRVEDITEALWGTRVSPSTVSNLNKKIYAKIEAWRNRRIEGEHPYLYLDGIVMKRSWFARRAGKCRACRKRIATVVWRGPHRTPEGAHAVAAKTAARRLATISVSSHVAASGAYPNHVVAWRRPCLPRRRGAADRRRQQARQCVPRLPVVGGSCSHRC